MIIPDKTKRIASFVLVLIFCCLMLTFQGCKNKRSEMASILYKRTHNIVFKDIDPDEFSAVFKKILARKKLEIANPQLISSNYSKEDYEPVFVMDHLWNGDLKAMVDKYRKAN